MTTLRYRVTAKMDTEATVEVQFTYGALAPPARLVKVPLARPLDPAVLAPAHHDGAAMKLVSATKVSLTVRGREFQCMAYEFAVRPEDGKPPCDEKLTLFVTPEAPVLGLVAVRYQSFIHATYTLAGGTGVDDMWPKTPAK